MKKLLIAFLLLIILVSCKQKDFEQTKALNINKINPNATDTYRSTILTIPDKRFQLGVNNNVIRVTGDRIYINGWIIAEEMLAEDRSVTFSCDFTGGDFREETSDRTANLIGTEYNMGDGTRILEKYVWNNDVFDGMVIQKYSVENKLVFEVDVDNIFNVDIKSEFTSAAAIAGDLFRLVNVAQYTDGNIYLASQKKIVALNETGAKLFDIQISGEISNLTVLTDDSVIVKYTERNNTNVIKYIDVAAQKLGAALKLPDSVDIRDSQIVIGPGYDLYIQNREGLFGYNIGGEPVLVVDWVKSNVVATGMSNLNVITTEKFIYTFFNHLNFTNELVLMDMIPRNELKERTPIILAKLCDNYYLDYYIQYFNRENEDYRIEFIDYTKYNTQDNLTGGVTIFNNEIAAGNIPDIIMWGEYSGFPIESYKDKGLFKNLYEFMDKDPDMKRENLMPYAYKPFEDNGKLYQLSTYIGFETYVGKKSLFPKTPMTPTEMINYSNSLSEDQYLSDMGLSYITSARTILDYVDNVNHKVYFDSDEFIELIRFYKNNWERMPPGRDSNDRYAHYRNDTIQLYRTNMNSLDEYNHLKNVFREDVTFVGYPTLSDNGAIIRANIAYGISEKSKHADIAWQFLKRMLADDIQYPGTKYRHVDTMPLTVSAMNKYIDYMLNHISVYGDNGGVWGYEKPLPEDHVEGFVVEITREEIDSIIDYMSNAKSYNATDYNFLWFEIIFEELRYDKTPEEIAKVIQNRAFIYINEKR